MFFIDFAYKYRIILLKVKQKCRKVMNLLKIKCIMSFFGVFTDIFSNFAANI